MVFGLHDSSSKSMFFRTLSSFHNPLHPEEWTLAGKSVLLLPPLCALYCSVFQIPRTQDGQELPVSLAAGVS